MKTWTVIGTWILAGNAGAADLVLARPFADHMVLPMDRRIPVWGTATAGNVVKVRFGEQIVEGRADADGKWKVMLPAMAASADGRRLEAACGSEQRAIADVLVGRIYLFSGQSNMDFPLSRAIGGKEEAARAGRYSAIRLCNLTGAPTDARPYDEATLARLDVNRHFTGTWQVSSPDIASQISAIAWWSGRLHHERLQVPIGVVENAVGGSGTEAWLPREVLESRPAYQSLLGSTWLECDKISAWARGRARQNLGSNLTANHPFRPGFLFESGLRWWGDFPFDGVCWYQGETNAERDDDAWNGRLLRDLVTGWRAALGQPELPFYLIQLPRIGGHDPLRQYWPQYREVQATVARDLPMTRLVVTRDLGWDSSDVHPPDKLPVARRLEETLMK